MSDPEVHDVTDRNVPLVRRAEEHFDLPLRHDPKMGWVDRNGKPVKTRTWADIRRTP